jgi:hypothetical protein
VLFVASSDKHSSSEYLYNRVTPTLVVDIIRLLLVTEHLCN